MAATNGNDILSTTAAGQTLDGLAGDDQLTSNYNNTWLIGRDGSDLLTTDVRFILGQVATGSAKQSGGSGDDSLSAYLSVSAGSANIDQDGGTGNDKISAYAYDSSGLSLLGMVDSNIHISGGAGDDDIYITNNIVTSTGGTVRNVISGGTGNDTINVSSETTPFGAYSSAAYAGSGSLATNTVDGGNGNDFMTAVARGLAQGDVVSNDITGGSGDDNVLSTTISDTDGSSIHAQNNVSGGDGNDKISAYHYAGSSLPGSLHVDAASDVTDVLSGGNGDDYISALSDTRGADNGSTAFHKLQGDGGNDTLISRIDATTSGHFLEAVLLGGTGNDTLDAKIAVKVDLLLNTLANPYLYNTLEGGAGNDNLTARITLDYDFHDNFHGQFASLVNTLTGGAGNDTLDASIDENENAVPSNLTFSSNVLSGGAGDDVLIGHVNSTVAYVQALSSLDGGAGNDQLTVFGGYNNSLNGGTGNDRLTGGSGYDLFTGGSGADTFVFVGRSDSGNAFNNADQINDFNARQGDRIDLTALGITAADLMITHHSGIGYNTNYTASVDFDRNGTVDFAIDVQSAQTLVSANFIF